MKITGKVAVITGASRGIGRATAMELAKRGAFVIVNYRGSEEAALETVAEIKSAGGDAVCMAWDVSDYAECEKNIKQIIDTFGRIDILVNNAGITRDDLLMKLSEEDFDAVIAANLKRYFLHAAFCFPSDASPKKRKGHQSCICSWNLRECRTGKLCGIQGRCDWHDKECGKGAGFTQYYSECGCTGMD